MNISNKLYFITVACLLLLLGVTIYLWRSSANEATEKENLEVAKDDTLHKIRNSLGQEVSYTSLLQASNTKVLLKLQSKDSTITTLQAEVKANKKKLSTSGSITDLYTITKGKFTGKTDSVKTKDSTKVGNIVYLYPEYKSHIIKDKWITADIIANRDSTTFSPMITNQFSILISGDTKNPIVQVTDLNPYTSTTALRSFQLINTLRQKSWGIGIQVGYGGQLYKGVINISPYIGIGISKNFVSW